MKEADVESGEQHSVTNSSLSKDLEKTEGFKDGGNVWEVEKLVVI